VALQLDSPVRIRTICFDATGTLFDVRDPVGTTYARLAERFGVLADPLRLADGFRDALRLAPPLAFPGARAGELPAHERRWWRAIVDAAFAAAGAPAVPAELFEAIFSHYAGGGAWKRYDDTLSALAALRRRGYALAIVSNFDGRLIRLVDELGIGPLVTATVCSTRAGAAKPDTRIFRHTLELLGARPAESLHVGDDPAADVAGALAAGLRAVRIDRRAEPEGAGLHSVPTVSSLAGLEPLLEGQHRLDE
jgi:putative hydrolase of the HAD superfamily